MEKVVTAYWNRGGFYLEPEPWRWHQTEASAHRRAHELGFSHMIVKHGYYSVARKEFVVNDNISGRKMRVPARYRRSEG